MCGQPFSPKHNHHTVRSPGSNREPAQVKFACMYPPRVQMYISLARSVPRPRRWEPEWWICRIRLWFPSRSVQPCSHHRVSYVHFVLRKEEGIQKIRAGGRWRARTMWEVCQGDGGGIEMCVIRNCFATDWAILSVRMHSFCAGLRWRFSLSRTRSTNNVLIEKRTSEREDRKPLCLIFVSSSFTCFGFQRHRLQIRMCHKRGERWWSGNW